MFLIPFALPKIIKTEDRPNLANIVGIPIPSFNPIVDVARVAIAVQQPSATPLPIHALNVPQNAVQKANDVRKIVANPPRMVDKIKEIAIRNQLESLGVSEAVYRGVLNYQALLQEQAKFKWKKLPSKLIGLLASKYQVNLCDVKYAENIETKTAYHITFPGEIFLAWGISPLGNEGDLKLLLHELVHIEQYEKLGGLRNFLDRYSADVIVKIPKYGFNSHDHLDFEQEALKKAEQLTPIIWEAIHAEPNYSSLRWVKTDSGWKTK